MIFSGGRALTDIETPYGVLQKEVYDSLSESEKAWIEFVKNNEKR